jgi:hypothetical protein
MSSANGSRELVIRILIPLTVSMFERQHGERLPAPGLSGAGRAI